MYTGKLVRYLKKRAAHKKEKAAFSKKRIEGMFSSGNRDFFGVSVDDSGRLLKDAQQPAFFKRHQQRKIIELHTGDGRLWFLCAENEAERVAARLTKGKIRFSYALSGKVGKVNQMLFEIDSRHTEEEIREILDELAE